MTIAFFMVATAIPAFHRGTVSLKVLTSTKKATNQWGIPGKNDRLHYINNTILVLKDFEGLFWILHQVQQNRKRPPLTRSIPYCLISFSVIASSMNSSIGTGSPLPFFN